ncbi:MAG: hypothetical protein WAO19_12310 [Candidatus Kryptoniota bacterium]
MVRHIFGVVVLIVFISGCSSPTNSGSGIANYPISNTDITVSGTVQVQTPANSGNAIFSVVCQLAYINQSGADSVFNSASISVNGMHLVHQYTDGTFYGSGLDLSAGDSVVFIFKHPIIGTIAQMLRVPPSITDCISQPQVPSKGVSNTSSNYSLAWGTGAVGASYYIVKAICYDSTKSVITTWSKRTGSNTLTFPSWVFQDSVGEVCPFVDLTVLPFNAISYPGFSYNSLLSVSSASYIEYSNL